MRLHEAKRDYYRRLARLEGYRSRAAYKLLQISRKYRILGPDMKVVDIGSSPGGWLQVCSELIGVRGLAVGVDPRPLLPISGNVHFIQGDIEEGATVSAIREKVSNGADVVLSDVSPPVSGVWEVDHIRQIDLTRRTVELLPVLLKRKGTAVFKLFEGPEVKPLLSELRRIFNRVELGKPDASRKASSELFVVCLDYLAPTHP